MRFGLVKDGKIIKERNIDETDLLLIAKMKAHSYLPIEDEIPVIDSETQYCGTEEYAIEKDRIVATKVIHERSVEDAIQEKTNNVNQETFDEIEAYMPIQQQVLILAGGTVEEKAELAVKMKVIRDAQRILIQVIEE